MSDNTMTTETIEEKFQSYLKQIVPVILAAGKLIACRLTP